MKISSGERAPQPSATHRSSPSTAAATHKIFSVFRSGAPDFCPFIYINKLLTIYHIYPVDNLKWLSGKQCEDGFDQWGYDLESVKNKYNHEEKAPALEGVHNAE